MGGGARRQGYSSQDWQFRSSVDPEELFRKIFGDQGMKSNPFSDFEEFAESSFGFGASQEVFFAKYVLFTWKTFCDISFPFSR